ncbi:Imm21 family immunity protein [Streptomyces sp. NPDC032472]|uniref:Imm21 family immunity protein n=1 Tax=Streptomyces sp. NPDC032472 TaxID=3155018 RepID=UPI0033F6CC0D
MRSTWKSGTGHRNRPALRRTGRWAGTCPAGRKAGSALVLGDEPAGTCYLSEQRIFLRWLAADFRTRSFSLPLPRPY